MLNKSPFLLLYHLPKGTMEIQSWAVDSVRRVIWETFHQERWHWCASAVTMKWWMLKRLSCRCMKKTMPFPEGRLRDYESPFSPTGHYIGGWPPRYDPPIDDDLDSPSDWTHGDARVPMEPGAVDKTTYDRIENGWILGLKSWWFQHQRTCWCLEVDYIFIYWFIILPKKWNTNRTQQKVQYFFVFFLPVKQWGW